MSGFNSIRRFTLSAVLMGAVTGATTLFAADLPATPVPTSAPATPPNPSLAFINGKEVNRDAFDAIMMQVAGMRVFQQVFDLTLVQNACVNAGIAMGGADYQARIQKEFDKALESMTITPVAGAAPLSKDEERNQRQAMLGQVLARQGVSAIEFRISLETRAGLRALAQGKTSVTDAEAESAYLGQNGERRTVHILVLPQDERTAAETVTNYKKLINEGKKTPEEAAAELKIGQPANWTISKNADNIDEIRKASFDLVKPGDFSAITTVKGQNGAPDQKIVILLDKIDADKTASNPKSAAVLADLKQKVYDAKEANWMNNQLQILRANATVDIKDPILQDQFNQMIASIRAQQNQAVPASAPTPGVTPASAPASMPAALPGATPRPAATLPAIPAGGGK